MEQLLKHRRMIENGYEKDKRLIPTWSQPFIFEPVLQIKVRENLLVLAVWREFMRILVPCTFLSPMMNGLRLNGYLPKDLPQGEDTQVLLNLSQAYR
ncbi:hypothetical protein BK122_11100 [Paenibacillus pabuli]|nr:hypothetical protein BK122_11100 [Paenibacillus pabuli]